MPDAPTLSLSLSAEQATAFAAGAPLSITLMAANMPPSDENDVGPAPRHLSLRQRQIARALLDKPLLGERQLTILRVLASTYVHVSAASLAKTLEKEGLLEAGADGENFVYGAIRSFGKRLLKHLTGHPPVRISIDREGDGVADPTPVLALVETRKIGGGMSYRLTQDGMIAVAAVLGAYKHSPTAGGIDPCDEVVLLAMSDHAATMLDRVARSLNLTRDEAVLRMTAAFGAG